MLVYVTYTTALIACVQYLSITVKLLQKENRVFKPDTATHSRLPNHQQRSIIHVPYFMMNHPVNLDVELYQWYYNSGTNLTVLTFLGNILMIS